MVLEGGRKTTTVSVDSGCEAGGNSRSAVRLADLLGAGEEVGGVTSSGPLDRIFDK